MNINLFNILIISGVVHGIIFSIVLLLSKKYKSKSNRYLAFVALCLSLHNLYYWFGDTNLSDTCQFYDLVYIPWNLLILPMYYLFVSSFLDYQVKNKGYYFLPFFLSLVIHLAIFLDYSFSEKVSFSYTPLSIYFFYTEEYIALAYTVFVIIKTFSLISKYQKSFKYSKEKVRIDVSWLKKLLYFGAVICCFWLLVTIYAQALSLGQLNTVFRYFVWVSISFLIYWLGYLGVYYGVINKERMAMRKRFVKKSSTEPPLTNSKIELIKDKILTEKLFLDPQISVGEISKRFDINENYFSHTFNLNSKENFSTFINRLRIEEAKLLLKNEDYNNYTIVAIALESGFNSKTAFYNTFKKHTGVSPSEYKKSPNF